MAERGMKFGYLGEISFEEKYIYTYVNAWNITNELLFTPSY